MKYALAALSQRESATKCALVCGVRAAACELLHPQAQTSPRVALARSPPSSNRLVGPGGSAGTRVWLRGGWRWPSRATAAVGARAAPPRTHHRGGGAQGLGGGCAPACPSDLEGVETRWALLARRGVAQTNLATQPRPRAPLQPDLSAPGDPRSSLLASLCVQLAACSPCAPPSHPHSPNPTARDLRARRPPLPPSDPTHR